MSDQKELFTPEQLRDEGIKRAVDHADQKNENWSQIAYNFLSKFIDKNELFTTEEVRAASIGIVPEPPHARAWGGIIVRAKNKV